MAVIGWAAARGAAPRVPQVVAAACKAAISASP